MWAEPLLSEAAVGIDDLCKSISVQFGSDLLLLLLLSHSFLPESGSLKATMASGLSAVVVLALFVFLGPSVSGEFDF